MMGHTKIIHLAGQIGTAPDGTIPLLFPEQVTNALRNVKLCLSATGATPRNIMSVTHYVVSTHLTDPARQLLWAEFLEGHTPPGTLVPLERLAAPSILFEVEVQAIVEVDEDK
jgi:monoamine oxidase